MNEPGRLELLQITLIVSDLEATAKAFSTELGLRVAFRDPSVALWGLDNIVLPMGTTFIEVLSPKPTTGPEETPGGRHLARLGGDGGYMVILQTRDLTPWRPHLEKTGVRIAFEADTQDEEHGQNWSGLHLNPADTGGMMISLDRPDPPDSWAGAGPHWRNFIAQDVVDGLVGIELRAADPKRLGQRWAEVLGRSFEEGDRIRLDRGEIHFRESKANEVDGLAAVQLHAADASRRGKRVELGGVRFELV